MRASIIELLDNLKPAVVWVCADGKLRYTNQRAVVRTGWIAGRTVTDVDLMRVVRLVLMEQEVHSARVGEMACRVMPGLTSDDAFVLFDANYDDEEQVSVDKLMRLIRNDMRTPLVEARAALSLAQQSGDAYAVEAAMDGVDTVLSTITKLLELARFWEKAPPLGDDRIELWSVLQQVWAETETLAREREVCVRFHAHESTVNSAALYGNPDWLRRMLKECLDLALLATPAGGSLDIDHQQQGARAWVVFRDLTIDAIRGGGPGAKSDARLELGYRMCERIATMHGGDLREEVDVDGRTHLLVDLPTGAPFNLDESALVLAQAEAHVHELPALVSRARARAAQETQAHRGA